MLEDLKLYGDVLPESITGIIDRLMATDEISIVDMINVMHAVEVDMFLFVELHVDRVSVRQLRPLLGWTRLPWYDASSTRVPQWLERR